MTQTVQKGGCAAKVAAHELRQILARVNFPATDSQVLVDGKYFDDAAIYKISNDLALVQTLDFFTPIVDSPSWFGKIATANALSDVYAMGGTPKTALGILAFPVGLWPQEIIIEVMNGACELLAEKRVQFLGGHSIDDDTLKFGLSVTGFVEPEKIWSNRKALVGDVLILTKALGTGTLTAGLKKSAWAEKDISEALQSMAKANDILPLLSADQSLAIHAATDITGFGFLGHALHIALGSDCCLNIHADQLPSFSLARESLQKGFLTKAHRTNKEYVAESVDFGSNLIQWRELLMLDPQTSGGLLLSVDPLQAQALLAALKSEFPEACVVGEVRKKETFPLVLK